MFYSPKEHNNKYPVFPDADTYSTLCNTILARPTNVPYLKLSQSRGTNYLHPTVKVEETPVNADISPRSDFASP